MNTPRLTPREIAELMQHVGYGSAWLGPVLVSGQGSRVTDIDGESYIDCTAQAGFPPPPRLLLAKRLADLCPGRLNVVTYAPTGSLGIETALKLALINRPEAQRFVTFYHAYHGNTFTTMAASWSGTQTSGSFGPGGKFLPFLHNFVRVPT